MILFYIILPLTFFSQWECAEAGFSYLLQLLIDIKYIIVRHLYEGICKEKRFYEAACTLVLVRNLIKESSIPSRNMRNKQHELDQVCRIYSSKVSSGRSSKSTNN